MKRLLIDTNALISFVTDRNPAQQKAVAPIFESASSLDHEVICHQVVLIEFVYVLDKIYNLPKKEINDLLRVFVNMPGITIVNDLDIETILSLWPEPIPDFGDAVIAGYAKLSKDTGLFTFDRKLGNAAKKLERPESMPSRRSTRFREK